MNDFLKNRFLKAILYIIVFAALIFACDYRTKTFDLFIRFILQAFITVLIGLFIATIFEPVVKYMEERKIKRTVSAIIILIILNVFLIFLLAEGIYILINECADIIASLQNIDYDKLYSTLDKLFANVKSIYSDLPRPLFTFIQNGINELTNILNQIATIGLKVIKVIPATLKGITIWFFSVLPAFFFIRDRYKMSRWIVNHFSAEVYKEGSGVIIKIVDSVVD